MRAPVAERRAVPDLSISIRMPRSEFPLDVDFVLPGLGITALFGPSGSGKTSVLRCIAGLERAAAGRIAFGTETWQDCARGTFVPAHRRACGYVFQEASLFHHLTVRDNLAYAAKRSPAGRQEASWSQTIHLLDIEPLLDSPASRLSGGERQRVAIARAVLAGPQLLLMDEPLASLDTSRKAEALYYIERLRDETGLPVLYVSHSVEEVVRLARHVVRLDRGRVVAEGSPESVLGGEGGTVIEVRVVGQDLEWGLARLAFPGGTLFAPDVDALVGETLRIRVSARDVSVSLSRPSDASFLNVLEGTVTAIGTGEGASVDVRLDVSGTPLIARITRRSVASLGLAPGQRAYALIKAVAVDRHSVGYA